VRAPGQLVGAKEALGHAGRVRGRALTDAFDKIGQFEKAHPGVTVKFNYNGSSSLATSINQGAPAAVV